MNNLVKEIKNKMLKNKGQAVSLPLDDLIQAVVKPLVP